MVVFAKYWKNLKNTVFWKFIKNYHLNCDKNHLKSNIWCLFSPPQKITAFRQAILEIIQIWTITLPTFQCQKTQVLQLFWTQNIALTGKKQPKYSFFTYQNPKKEMELSKFIIFNKMGVFSSISIQTTLSCIIELTINSFWSRINIVHINYVWLWFLSQWPFNKIS